ncbi:MAG: endonuclease/exonuclease/phosphatase family protein, partial [Ruminococcaceae bacterium]|nr:endonuclease/exonuclease/phosphatase family protein [Oscillospiraceae bacterium]
AFPTRREFVKAEFPKYNADIIGFQETKAEMREWLIDNFTDYQICGMGRNHDLGGESNVVAFNKDKFDLISLDTFWLSDTPRLPGSRFSTDQSGCPRICTCTTLYHKETKKALRHYNTHLDHQGQFAQAQGISLILNRIASDYAEWQLPVILTGDFNVKPDSVVRKSVVSFEGCGSPLVDVTENVGSTFHGYRPDKISVKIDYIFTNLPCDKSKSFTAKDEKDGIFLSDHYPVGAFLEI